MNPWALSADGFELQFATNHLGHFLLTKLLLPVLEQSAPSRVVTVSSAAAFFPDYLATAERLTGLVDAKPASDFENLGAAAEASYTPQKAYGRSKLANVLFTQALAERLAGKKIYANSCNPGGIDTNLGRHVEKEVVLSFGESVKLAVHYFFSMIMLTPPQGAVTQLYLATSPEVESKDIRGEYYRPQAMRTNPPNLANPEMAERLWAVSEKLVADFL